MSDEMSKVERRVTRGVLLSCVLMLMSCALVPASALVVQAQQNKAEDRTPPRSEGVPAATTVNPAADARQGKPEDRGTLADEVGRRRAELAESERLLLAPSAEDLEAHADFLKQRNTGLVRLLPRETFDGKVALRGGGAYYSFTRLTHEYGHGSDIELSQDHFSIGFAGANFGLLVNLGDVPLAGVTRETFGVRRLAEFEPPASEPKAREEQRRSAEGFQSEGFTYRRRLPVRLDDTYALRSIDYDRSDVLVAFRVVRKDSDGSVVLLWKLLKKYSKPRLERNSASSG
jgi:hypothetical protein